MLMPWLSQVSAVLEAWYPGQNGGPAIANLLFGAAESVRQAARSPSRPAMHQLPRPAIPQPPDGSTPFPVELFTRASTSDTSGIDAKGSTPLFPFGFGLSYTTFSSPIPRW